MLKKLKILAIDDDPHDLQMVEYALKSLDYIGLLSTAVSGEDALEKSLNVDLILLDINLPGISGKETLTKIKQSPYSPIVIMLSTSSYAQDIRESLLLGADAYITKPFQIKELKRKIDTVCRYWFNTIERP